MNSHLQIKELIIISRKYFAHGKNRIVNIDEDGRLVYEYLTGNTTAYCTFHPILYAILNKPDLSPFLDRNDGIRFKLQKKSSVIDSCKLSLLAQACYDGYVTSVERWQSEYKKYRNWMNNFGYHVDHADSNQQNCTVYNLSIIPNRLNNNKNDLTAWITHPVIFYSGHYGQEYRISAYWPNLKYKKTGRHGVRLNLKCSSAADYVSCIQEIEKMEVGYGKPTWALNENGELVKAQLNRRKKDCWKGNRHSVTKYHIENSLKAQEQIAWMFDCEFKLYWAGEVNRFFNEAVEQ